MAKAERERVDPDAVITKLLDITWSSVDGLRPVLYYFGPTCNTVPRVPIVS